MAQLPSTRFTASGGPIGASTLNAAINPLIGVINYHTHDPNDGLGGYGGPIPQWGPDLGTFYVNNGPGSAIWNATLVGALVAIPADPAETWISPNTTITPGMGIGGELQKIRGVIATLLGQPNGSTWAPTTMGQFLQYDAGTNSLTIGGTVTGNTLATSVAPGTPPINVNNNVTLSPALTAQYLGDTLGNHYAVSTLPGGLVYTPQAFSSPPSATGTGPFTTTTYVTYSYSGGNGPGNPYEIAGGSFPSIVPATTGNNIQASVALNNTNITAVQFFADTVTPPRQVGTVGLSYSAGTWTITTATTNTGGGTLVGVSAGITGSGTAATLTITATDLPFATSPVAANLTVDASTSPFLLATDANGFLNLNYIASDNEPFTTLIEPPITLADELQNIRNVLYSWSQAFNSASTSWITPPLSLVSSISAINTPPVAGSILLSGTGGVNITEAGGNFTIDGSQIVANANNSAASLLMGDFFEDTIVNGLSVTTGTGLVPAVTPGNAYVASTRQQFNGSYAPPAATPNMTQYLDWNGLEFVYSTASAPVTNFIRLAQIVAAANVISSVTNLGPTGLRTTDVVSADNIALTPTTTTTAPTAGTAAALPATPAGYWEVSINGVTRSIPYY